MLNHNLTAEQRYIELREWSINTIDKATMKIAELEQEVKLLMLTLKRHDAQLKKILEVKNVN